MTLGGPGIFGGVGGLGAAPLGRRLLMAMLMAMLMAAAAGGIAGCASLGVSDRAAPGETLSGRLSVRVDGQAERGLSADFELSGSAPQGRLRLSGPLGTTLAQASWAPGQAVLASAGSETRFPDLDSLATAALGEPLPMAALFDWLRGRPWPAAASELRGDGVPGFAQLGWQIDLARWAEGWVEARRVAPPRVSVRVRLDMTE